VYIYIYVSTGEQISVTKTVITAYTNISLVFCNITKKLPRLEK